MSSETHSSRRLTVAIIARNAAEALAETLVSIRNLADEIVVLDTGSTDETPMIAERLGAKLHRRAWDESFAGARNACLTHASGDFILWLTPGSAWSGTMAGCCGSLLWSKPIWRRPICYAWPFQDGNP